MEFIRNLADRLGISDLKRVFVVPGNHDVDWTASLKPRERFARYIKWTKDFSTPGFDTDTDEPDPLLVELSDFCSDVDGQLLFLISPMFGGLPALEAESLQDRLGELLEGKLTPEQIRGVVSDVTRSLDIAAIGGNQRRRMVKKIVDSLGDRRASNMTRIAILHHHLLPDSQLDVKEFEAVLDAGRVLHELVRNEFDLALTGHKHNLRTLHFRQSKAEGIDVFCAPALFPEHGTTTGFTLIDIYGGSSPYYAILDHRHASNFGRVKDPPTRLWRNSQAFSDLARELWPISAKYHARLIPTAGSLRKAFDWCGHPNAKDFFDKAWRQVAAMLEDLGMQRVVVTGQEVKTKWPEIVSIARQDDQIRLVSLDDLRYWIGALKLDSAARKYTDPLHTFPGKKWRILILSRHNLKTQPAEVRRVIEDMHASGFRLTLVVKETLPNSLRQDFGLLGDFAFYKFQGLRGQSRTLILDFKIDSVRETESNWGQLKERGVWDTGWRQGNATIDWPDFLRKKTP